MVVPLADWRKPTVPPHNTVGGEEDHTAKEARAFHLRGGDSLIPHTAGSLHQGKCPDSVVHQQAFEVGIGLYEFIQ